MSKTTVWAIALAAVLAMAAVPFSSIAVWADDESEDRKKGKNTSEERRSSLLAGSGGSTTLKGIVLTGKGLGVEKTENSLTASDAILELAGVVKKGSVNQARMTVEGTVDIDSVKFNVLAQGKIDLKKSGFGKLNIEGKIRKGDSDQKFQLKALLLPTEDDTKWKVVTEKAVAAGRQYRIYAFLGDMVLERSALPTPPVEVDKVELTPAEANIDSDGTATFTAVAKDASGATITGATFVWTLSIEAAGTLVVSADGTSAVFTDAGTDPTTPITVTVSATSGGATATDSSTVNVNPPPAP